jgi:hypothetical protein
MAPTSVCEQGALIHSSTWSWRPIKARSRRQFRFRLALPTFPSIHREMMIMPDKITYYAIVDALSSRERPAGVSDPGHSDQRERQLMLRQGMFARLPRQRQLLTPTRLQRALPG